MTQHPDDLDARLREWADHTRALAPPVAAPALSAHPVRRGRWAAAIAVAAAVIATAIALPLSLQPHTTSPFPTLSGTATATPGTWPATFHGITLDIPDSWNVLGYEPCGVKQNSVLFPGPVSPCGSTTDAGVTTTQFMVGDSALTFLPSDVSALRTSSVTIDGLPGTRGDGTTSNGVIVAISVPDLYASVQFIGPDMQAIQPILDSLKIVAVDDLGCPTTSQLVATVPTGKAAVRNDADTELLPASPTSIRVCRYIRGYLEQSAELTPAQITAARATLNALPPGLTESTLSPKSQESECRKPGHELGPGPADSSFEDSEAWRIQSVVATLGGLG
jgi:hypothetical protein